MNTIGIRFSDHSPPCEKGGRVGHAAELSNAGPVETEALRP